MDAIEPLRQRLGAGLVIPACPLALNASRRFDERRQRALLRYYAAAGAHGVAVGVHTTQFAIREPQIGLLRPVLQLASETLAAAGLVRIGGVCGPTRQAVAEASLARDLGYDAALLSLGALKDANDDALIAHCRSVAEVLPLFGFYLQPSVGGRLLPYSFWRRFADLERVVAIKIAPFNRYATAEVIRAVVEAGREDVALYTGNDDHILLDLLTPFGFPAGGQMRRRHIVGGLLGQWAVWTKRAVELHAVCRRLVQAGGPVPPGLLQWANDLTEANAALFDAAHGFAGCIAGLHEILRRQGLFEGAWCLDPHETLSPGQLDEINRVCAAYPHLTDDGFVEEHRDEWLRG